MESASAFQPRPDVPGRLVLDWAGRAEERGFSSLATIDRIAYPSYDSLTALTAAAAVTDRIGLLTNILLGPAYNPVQLAKVTASLDQLSGGRLTLGLGVGGRADDYQRRPVVADRVIGSSRPGLLSPPGRASRWPAARSRSARRPPGAASRC